MPASFPARFLVVLPILVIILASCAARAPRGATEGANDMSSPPMPATTPAVPDSYATARATCLPMSEGGRPLLRLGENQELAHACSIVIEARREPSPLLAFAYIQRAVVARAPQGQSWCQIAIPDLDEATRLAPENLLPYSFRGTCYRLAGRFDDALREYDLALPHTNPENRWTIFHGRGDVYLSAQRPTDAIASYDEAVRLAPGVAENYRDRAMMWLALRQSDRALADINRAIELAPADPLAYAVRSHVHAVRGDQAAAQEDLARFRQLAPGVPFPF